MSPGAVVRKTSTRCSKENTAAAVFPTLISMAARHRAHLHLTGRDYRPPAVIAEAHGGNPRRVRTAQRLGGASTSEYARTASGRRAPRTCIAATAALSSANSAVEKRIAEALLFSTMCGICVVPGMGTIQGFCANSHAIAIWPGVACFRSAQRFTRATSARLWGRLSGAKRDSMGCR